MGDPVAFVRQTPLFTGLSDEDCAKVAGLFQSRQFARGEVVFRQGDPGGVLYLIAEGQIKISLASTGNSEVILDVLGPGETFGELSLLDGEERSAQATALGPVQAYTLRQSDLFALLVQKPAIAIALLRQLCTRLRRANERLNDISFLTLQARLAKRILELAEEANQGGHGPVTVPVPLTAANLAPSVGSSIEETRNQLEMLQQLGLVEIREGQVTQVHPRLLRRLVRTVLSHE